jgi:processive 1,2-diacylglycerol beta-glucosyltransferase
MKTIDLVYFDAGGGHRAAALALQAMAAEQRRPWQVRLVNLTQVLDPQARFRRLTGFEPEDYYNTRLRRGWTIGLAQELKLLQAMIRLGHAPMMRALERQWRRTRPDLVVSVVPNFNRVLCESLAAARPGAPYVTVMTDLADHPPNFWIEPDLAQTLVCGTPRAVDQAHAAGMPGQRVRASSGMILRPAFYKPCELNRAEERRALGLDADAPVGIVMFGGHGSVQMLRIAKALPDTQLIFACGHNVGLVADLQALKRRAAHAAVGFTQDVPRLMRLADFFVGKPGPGSLSEAVHLGLPVITFDMTTILPQERYNVDWVRERGLGLAVPSVRALGSATSELLTHWHKYLGQVRAVENRAVFEVLDLLEDLLADKPLRQSERII